MDALRSFSDSVAGVVEAAGASVVRIDARRRWPGTGIVWTPDGIIVTADHVLGHDDRIQIGLPDGRTVPATLVGRDPTTDLAVLRAAASGLTPPAWEDRDVLRVGHLVLAIARPGRTVRAGLGIVAAHADSWRTPAGGEIDRYLEADIRRARGFSGALLVDTGGRSHGLVTAGLMRRHSVVVPVATLRRVVATLLAYGRIRRGYLGVGTHPVRLPAALAQQLRQDTGLLVVGVKTESPAERAGILLGDVIVAIGGQPVGGLDDLLAALGGDRVGSSVAVRIVRAGEPRELTVMIGERAA